MISPSGTHPPSPRNPAYPPPSPFCGTRPALDRTPKPPQNRGWRKAGQAHALVELYAEKGDRSSSGRLKYLRRYLDGGGPVKRRRSPGRRLARRAQIGLDSSWGKGGRCCTALNAAAVRVSLARAGWPSVVRTQTGSTRLAPSCIALSVPPRSSGIGPMSPRATFARGSHSRAKRPTGSVRCFGEERRPRPAW